MKKQVAAAMLAASMAVTGVASLGSTPVNVMAASYITESGIVDFGDGSASITIQGNESQSLIGKKFNVYKLFNAENSVGGESINYSFNDTYKVALQNVVGGKLSKTPSEVTEYEVIDYIQSLNSNVVNGAQADQTLEGNYSDFRYFVEELRDEIISLGFSGDTVTVDTVSANNSVKFTGLDYGYYVVDEVTEVDGENSTSSLIMVNTANPDAEIDIKSDCPPDVVKKVKEDDNTDEVGNDGWSDMADYEIGQAIPFEYKTTLTNMNGYDEYYLAFHDVMDEALTFDKDSVEITISDGEKEYTMTSTEFSVVESQDADTTFKVEISDIKAIVDREFDNIDELGHNTYGQEVTVSYNAKLNDKAIEDTGRPGFENDVRIEYSNDPDSAGKGSTGFSEWDTVAVFTYKLDVLKTNNDGTALEDAKFKLYYDEDCTKEVYVKATEKGYIVVNSDSVDAGVTPVEMSSNANGNFIIFGLDDGTYYLKETEAPDGYRKIEDPITLNIDATFIADRNEYIKGDGATDKALVDLKYSAYIKQFVNGKYETSTEELVSDVDAGSANLTVVNHVGSKLPVTGSSLALVMVVLGSAGMVGGIKTLKKREQ